MLLGRGGYEGRAIVREDWSGWWLGRMRVTGGTGRFADGGGTTIDRHIYADVTTYMPAPGPATRWLDWRPKGESAFGRRC